METYINHPILGSVGVRAAYVEPIAISHRLYHPYMVPAVKVLGRKKVERRKLNSAVRRAFRRRGESRRKYGQRQSWICSSLRLSPSLFVLFGKAGKARRDSVAVDHVARVFRGESAGNELALSSRREYLRGPYTSTATHTRCIRMKPW